MADSLTMSNRNSPASSYGGETVPVRYVQILLRRLNKSDQAQEGDSRVEKVPMQNMSQKVRKEGYLGTSPEGSSRNAQYYWPGSVGTQRCLRS